MAGLAPLVRHAKGLLALPPPGLPAAHVAPLPRAKCDHPDRLAPLLTIGERLLSMAPSDGRAMDHALRLWRAMIDWVGVSDDDVDAGSAIAMVIARAAPPVGCDLPDVFGLRPVLPSTAAADIDVLRRMAREGRGGMARYAEVLQDRRLRSLLKAIGGRVKRLQTEKKPLLFTVIRDATRPTLDMACAEGFVPTPKTQAVVRDAFALVFAVCFGTRVSELLGLEGKDVNLVRIGEQDAVEATFVDTKTRSSPFGTHQPFRVVNAHPYLLQAWDAFNKTCGFPQHERIFVDYRTVGAKAALRPLSRDWFVKVVKQVDSECTPHSARAGMATELWAAGASLDDIMSMGRWTSAAAVLYIIGTVDRQVSASRLIGRGMVRYETGRLRQQLNLTADGSPLLRADAGASARWPETAKEWLARRSVGGVTMG